MFRPRLWTNTSIKLAWRVFMSTVRQQNTVQSHKIKNYLLHRKNMDYIAILLYKTHDIPRCHLNRQLAGHNTSAMDDLAYCELYDPCRILPTLSRNHTFQNKTWTLKKHLLFTLELLQGKVVASSQVPNPTFFLDGWLHRAEFDQLVIQQRS